MNIDENILYEPVRYWAKLPHPMFFKEATSVAVDSKDNVYVFNRGKYPLIIFDKDGNFLDTWGEGEFIRPHGIKIDKEDNLYLVDDMAHFVQKRTKNGDLIWQLGDTNNPGENKKVIHLISLQILLYILKLVIYLLLMVMVTQEYIGTIPKAIYFFLGVNQVHSQVNFHYHII